MVLLTRIRNLLTLMFPDQLIADKMAKRFSSFMKLMNPASKDRVLDIGVTSREYRSSDNYFEKHYPFLFVIPSQLEGLPIVLLEELSYGNCVLASDIEPNVDVLKPSQEELHGVLFSNGNDDSLEDKLRQLICNPGVVDEFKAKRQYFLKGRYNWDKVDDAYEPAYAATCGLRTAVPVKAF